ncbi:MAG: flagellar filament capping protein FliD, partial [Oscillospiraceae bacterium]|nr:flagellar filament capping protein FliD [Oscillospiraceae bacterium]
ENGNTVKDAQDNPVYAHGSDAEFEVEVDGVKMPPMTRSSNTFDIDGLNITLKETFTSGDAVTFSTTSDADKIVDAVKEMVKDYNAMMTEIKDAYSTMPLKDSKGNDYMPLTDEDQEDMSESAVANYEKKAKTGLLFADRDLSNFYSNMTETLKAFGITGNDGTGIGITTSYSNGTTTLVVDENALRRALENNPDKVRDVFTGKNGNDGVMQKMKNQLDTYAGTTGASKGILINKAGSTLAPTSIYQNTLQKELDDFEDEIESWQEKISDKIDYYNKKFTSLEKLIAQMNNQSSMLGGLSGGY